MENVKLSIIVPVYYNADTLDALYEDLLEKVLRKLSDYELIFVDDGSGDESWNVMERIREKDDKVRNLHLSKNFGEHAALLAGLSVCRGACAVTKQADLQEDSELILEMYKSWQQGNKVVLAARARRNENPIKVFLANRYYALVRRMVNPDMPPGGCDCYLIDRKVIEVLKLMDEKNSSLTLQVMWLGFQTDVIYFVREDRKQGKSRWTMAKKIKLAIDSILSFSYAPLRLMMRIGIVFNLLALGLMIEVFIEKYTIGTPVIGWASLMCVCLCGFGIIMIMLGLIGEYVWRALDASRARPAFLIETETGTIEK